MVKQIAACPLPVLPPCNDRHFAQCLRVMNAALPKRAIDDLGGELFFGVYRRQLGEFPSEAISHLTDAATRTCKWFPTIAECLEILGGWVRSDAAAQRRWEAQRLIGVERRAREQDSRQDGPQRDMSQGEINAMPVSLRTTGLTLGFITREQFDAAQALDEKKEAEALDAAQNEAQG